MNLIYKYLNIKRILTEGDPRSLIIKRNIIGSSILKCVSILISLQIVPLTIDFVNPTQYGIWLTLSSIIAWLNYFDIGLAHGFRNRFAEAIALNDVDLAKKYVSTTYAVLFLLFTSILLITLVINSFVNWSNILNIDEIYNEELRVVFGILACFFCTDIVSGVFSKMLISDQKTALVSLIQTGGQLLAFICIYILTKTITGNLTILALSFSGIPCLLMLVVSICVFRGKKYRIYKPSIKSVQFSLAKNILGLGGQFFVIMISMLLIFQVINIIISRNLGPIAVTQYNVAYKYYNVLNMASVIILTPFWSAFTDAYVKRDFNWMKRMVKKLEKLWIMCIPAIIGMILCSNLFFRLWIGDSVHITISLSLSIGLYVLAQISGNIYMYMINGTGKVRLQMILYLLFAFVSIPLMNALCAQKGIEGVLITPTIIFFLQGIVGKIQIDKIVNGKASGIFNK